MHSLVISHCRHYVVWLSVCPLSCTKSLWTRYLTNRLWKFHWSIVAVTTWVQAGAKMDQLDLRSKDQRSRSQWAHSG